MWHQPTLEQIGFSPLTFIYLDREAKTQIEAGPEIEREHRRARPNPLGVRCLLDFDQRLQPPRLPDEQPHESDY